MDFEEDYNVGVLSWQRRECILISYKNICLVIKKNIKSNKDLNMYLFNIYNDQG